MKKLLALAFGLALAGCHLHDEVCHYDTYGTYHCHDYDHDETTYYPENGGGDNNIIIVEETYSQCMWEPPYYHDPEYCTFDYETCCMWLNIGSEEQWCYYDYYGWELVSVYEYY